MKLSTAPLTFRCVLIVEIKNTQHWQTGIAALERQLSRQTDAAFAGTAHSKVYWIGTIGPHWRYGEKEDDGQNPTPLIDWHHTTHNQASFDDLQVLTSTYQFTAKLRLASNLFPIISVYVFWCFIIQCITAFWWSV